MWITPKNKSCKDHHSLPGSDRLNPPQMLLLVFVLFIFLESGTDVLFHNVQRVYFRLLCPSWPLDLKSNVLMHIVCVCRPNKYDGGVTGVCISGAFPRCSHYVPIAVDPSHGVWRGWSRTFPPAFDMAPWVCQFIPIPISLPYTLQPSTHPYSACWDPASLTCGLLFLNKHTVLAPAPGIEPQMKQRVSHGLNLKQFRVSPVA